MRPIQLIIYYGFVSNWRIMAKIYIYLLFFFSPIAARIYHIIDRVSVAKEGPDPFLVELLRYASINDLYQAVKTVSIGIACLVAILQFESERSTGRLSLFFVRIKRSTFFTGMFSIALIFGIAIRFVAVVAIISCLAWIGSEINRNVVTAIAFDFFRILPYVTVSLTLGLLFQFGKFKKCFFSLLVFILAYNLFVIEIFPNIPKISFLASMLPASPSEDLMTLAVSSLKIPWSVIGMVMVDNIGYTVLAFLIGLAAIERLEIPTRPTVG